MDFYVMREAGDSPKTDLKLKLGILWRPELAHIQEQNGLPGYKQKSKKFVTDKIIERVPEDILNVQISQELFERDYNEIGAIIGEYKKRRGY